MSAHNIYQTHHKDYGNLILDYILPRLSTASVSYASQLSSWSGNYLFWKKKQNNLLVLMTFLAKKNTTYLRYCP